MRKDISYRPGPSLSKYIDRIYFFKESSTFDFELPPVFPGTGLELLFNLGRPLSVNKRELPKVHTVCPRKMFRFDKTNTVSFISVRFKSGAFRHFSPIPFSQLNDDYCSMKVLWANMEELSLPKIGYPTKIQSLITEIESFLKAMFDCYHDEKNDKWDDIIETLYYNFKNNTTKDMAAMANLSLRQFERGFKMQFGTTAKEFQKVARFQKVVKSLLLNRNPKYLNTLAIP